MDSNQPVSRNEEREQFIRDDHSSIVIPVTREEITIEKEVIETGKVYVRTRVKEEEANINVPVVSEHYEIDRVPVNQVYPTPPPVRYEGDILVVPVIEEIVVVEKRYKVTEEVRLTKKKTETPYLQQITLRKEVVQVERISSDGDKQKF